MEKKYRILINGKLLDSPTGKTMEVINPANGKVVGLDRYKAGIR